MVEFQFQTLNYIDIILKICYIKIGVSTQRVRVLIVIKYINSFYCEGRGLLWKQNSLRQNLKDC